MLLLGYDGVVRVCYILIIMSFGAMLFILIHNSFYITEILVLILI